MRPRPDQILDYREYPILYVDDEVENLRIFELTFRREFSIITATSAGEALELFNREPIALVLSDQKMPGMLGTQFLSRVAALDEKTIRILVTAYGDADTLGEAINSGSIYRYIPKPWTPEEMRMTVRRGIEVYALDRERDHLVRELTLLNRVSKTITKELDVAALLRVLLDTITQDFGYDAAGILTFNRNRNQLTWEMGDATENSVSRFVNDLVIDNVTAPRFLTEMVEGRIQLLPFQEVATYEAPIRQWITEVAAEELLVVPMIGKNGLIGAFWCDNRRGGDRFTSDDCTLLEGLANQASIAMENARLVEDLRRSREQILQSDRLGTLGTLAAGLAHEINNPLVSIRTFLEMAPEKRFEEDLEFWSDYHLLASSEVERIRRLVETMRQLGRNGSGEADHEMVDLKELANQVLVLVKPEAHKAGVQIEVESGAALPKLLAVRDHMHQVMMNLLLNAIEATPEGGKVRLRFILDQIQAAVGFEVADNGPGIADEDLGRVFDPFFTTKGPDRGTGLGLMICHRIVTDHNGTIELRSLQGEGASFCVRIPLAPSGSERY